MRINQFKSLGSGKLTSIENTNLTFGPQFEMELSKAVEISSDAYFQKPFGGRRKLSW
jgi:hypothetical protein